MGYRMIHFVNSMSIYWFYSFWVYYYIFFLFLLVFLWGVLCYFFLLFFFYKYFGPNWIAIIKQSIQIYINIPYHIIYNLFAKRKHDKKNQYRWCIIQIIFPNRNAHGLQRSPRFMWLLNTICGIHIKVTQNWTMKN